MSAQSDDWAEKMKDWNTETLTLFLLKTLVEGAETMTPDMKTSILEALRHRMES